MEHPGIIFAHHPQFMFPMEPLIPTEHISRRRESGHELISSVPSTRCRSVETPAIHPRARTPDQGFSSSKPMNQQRSTSLTDVHSWVLSGSTERLTSPSRPQTKPSPKDPGTDQVKSYEPFTALMNVAAGARPIVESVRESQRGRDSLKISEAERPQPQFTRQSCVVTNTSVLHVTSGPKETSGSQAHGISSGLAPPQPPPLLSITGTQPPRGEGVSNPRLIDDRRMGLRDIQDSPRVVNPREMVNPWDPTHGAPTTFSHSPKEQLPPPLVRDTATIGLRRTPPTRDLIGWPNQDLLPCGCRSTEPCKHQLYSQEVPYVQRVDTRNMREVEQKQPGLENTPLPSREVEPSNRKTLFRPWTEKIVKDSAKSSSPLKTVSPPVQLKQTGVPLHSQQSQKRLSGSPLGGVRTPPASVISHSYSQQPGVLIPHPSSSSPQPEPHTRSSHPKDDPLSLAQERGPRSVLSHAVALEVTPRPSSTPQGPTPQLGSSTSHLQRPPDSSTELHPSPHIRPPRSRSPLPQQSSLVPTSQPNDPSTQLRNLREPSIIRSPHPPPLMPGVRPSTPQPTQLTHPIPYFPHLSGTSRSSPMVLGMAYPFSHPPGSMYALPNQPTIQESRDPSTLIQGRGSHPGPFQPVLTSQHDRLRPDLLYSGNISRLARDGTRLPFEQSRPSSEQSRAVLEHSRKLSDQFRTASDPTSTEESSVLPGPSRVSTGYQNPTVPKSFSPGPQSVSSGPQSVSPRLRSISPEPQSINPGPQSVSSRPQSVSPGPSGHGLVKSPAPVDNNETPKSPFIEQAELHQPSFDTLVDIQRHVNPSYTSKTGDDLSLDPRDDVSSASPTNNQGILCNERLFLLLLVVVKLYPIMETH